MALAAPALAAPAPDARSFRDALGRFATGVAFVTAAPDGEPVGLIVNSLASVSLEPPLVSFSPARSSLTWSRMRRTGRFGVNVLGCRHERFAKRATPAGADRFAGLDWEPGRGGVPLLTDALASLECEIVAEHPTGDHWIVVGRVDDLHVSAVDVPLVFYVGDFGTLQQPSRPWARSPEDRSSSIERERPRWAASDCRTDEQRKLRRAAGKVSHRHEARSQGAGILAALVERSSQRPVSRIFDLLSGGGRRSMVRVVNKCLQKADVRSRSRDGPAASPHSVPSDADALSD
jgi:3-hydroxy-9,10-secoandrosta-1,3,5(10)-triene-9,17-dione monooxygenase reductase component